MIYLDTSVLVALHTREPTSAVVGQWYGSCKERLVSATWCVTEFASALSIKLRTGQIQVAESRAARKRLERPCANDIQLIPVDPATFHRAARLALDFSSGLRAEDALHLAAALEAKITVMATLDSLLAHQSARAKLKLVLQ